MFVAGIDGCRGGWVAFKVRPASLNISVELFDLRSFLKKKPDDLAILAIGIPIARRVCEPERDANGLMATIWY